MKVTDSSAFHVSIVTHSSRPGLVRPTPADGFGRLFIGYDLNGLNVPPEWRDNETMLIPESPSPSAILKPMATVTEIGSLLTVDPTIRAGRPCIAGTAVSVHRIARWHSMGLIPEEIARKIGHISLAQVHAALAYYHSNQREIDADLKTEDIEADALAAQHKH